MTVSQSATGTSGAGLARFSGVTGTPNLRTGTYSMTCRVKFGSSATNIDMMLANLSIASDGRGFFIQRRSGDPATRVIIYRYNGVLTFNTANLDGAYGSTTDWVHIGATYDGSTIRTYLNGVAGGTVASASTLIATGNADAISALGPCTADVADVAMFGRALSAAEMLALSEMRVPAFGLADCFFWLPMIETSSLSNAGIDYSGTGNNATLQNSGANNPAASSVSVPVPWSCPTALSAVRLGAINVTGAGSVSVSGAASMTKSAPLVAAGSVNVTGAAALTAAAGLVSAGSVQVTGSAAMATTAPLVGAGSVQTTGAAVMTAAAGLAGAGSVQVTGAAAVTSSAALVASGSTQCTGVAVMTSSAGLVATGLVQTTGAAELGASGTSLGTTQCTGSAAMTKVAVAGSAGLVSVSGVASMTSGAGVACSGLTSCTGAANVTVTYSLVASGLTQCTGSAAFTTTSEGASLGGRQGVPDRRWFDLAGRRKARG